MGVRLTDPPFLTEEEQAGADIVAALESQIEALKKEVAELKCDLDLADLTIDRYSRGLM